MEIFINDEFKPADEAAVSVQDRGLLYGDGLFETLRAENGRPCWLAQHLARLTASAAALNLRLPSGFPWEARLAELLQRNRLTEGPAAVKILITRGEAPELGLPPPTRPTLIIYAKAYVPPPPEEYQRGWPVVSFPEPRTSFLSRHKSLNYLFCLAARQYAVDQGAREALILEPDGLVAEGAATALLWQENGRLYRPAAASLLPSVTLAVLAAALAPAEEIVAAPVTLTRLLQAEGVWLANSLLGLMPVASLNGFPLPQSSRTGELQRRLWDQC